MKRVLVFGFYGKYNLGDDLFIDAFKKLFPNIQFTFVDHIEYQHLNGVDALFFGGGSFLDGKPPISNDALSKIVSMPIFYLGVGSETDIHPIHIDLIKIAKLVAIRSVINKELFISLNNNTIVISDLVYALTDSILQRKRKSKSVLILPNISVIPQYNKPYWEHVFWDKFKLEFAQFLDMLIDGGYEINFFSMCKNRKLNDDFASMELISKMKYRDSKYLIDCKRNISSISKLFSSYEKIITQRYHGTILANMCKTPNLTIHHHNKLKHNSSVSYFEITKQKLINSFYSCSYNDIYIGEFIELIDRVNELL